MEQESNNAQFVEEENATGGGLATALTATAAMALSACAESLPNSDTGESGIDNRCGCMPPGATPPTGAVPGTPVAVAPGAGPTNPTPQSTAFSAIGPGAATLTVADMMTSITLSDGNVVPAWSFAGGGAGFNGDRFLPGPVVECVENAPMALTLSTMMAHTIHLHGLDVDTSNDGVPSTSAYVIGQMMPGVTPPVPPAVAGYASTPSPFTYNFTPRFAGTYMYHCHVDTVLHMEMGMWGTVIVRPADGSRNSVWSGGPVFDREYIWHLHTLDTSWHSQTRSSSQTARYNPDYFLINGREGAALLSDPATAIQAVAGQRVLVRLVNPGYLVADVSLGGAMFEVVSSDGRPLRTVLNTSSLQVGPGERYDIILTMPVLASSASVKYLNPMGTAVLGNAVTAITPV